ncbi:MAG: UvrD-helicase domain-containing protein, partial [Pseudomonadota bacterium]
EMAGRLFDLLGAWALMPDDALNAALRDLEGTDGARGPTDLAEARRLFARALETPGGLKIQTIHAFCEAVLRRFPLEAGVAPGFSVLDDADAQTLAAAAVDAAARQAVVTDADEPPQTRLARRIGPERARELLVQAVASRQTRDRLLDRCGGWPALTAAAAAALGVDPSAPGDEAAALHAAASVLSRADAERARAGLLAGGKKAIDRAQGPLTAFLRAESDAARQHALNGAFLTEKGAPLKSLTDKQVQAFDPGLDELLKGAQERYVAATDRWKAARVYADTAAYLSLVERASARFSAAKAARAALDFDDMVTQTRRLLADPSLSAWVLYKLDAGLDHILLDEAQDTSPAQWDVVEAPLEEFFSGDGRTAKPRSFFAVGDQKQSIYSFQGASAGLFDEKRIDLGKRIAASGVDYAQPSLALSFRSTAPVLAFVDAAFADDDAALGLGLSDGPLRHAVKREGAAGSVALWPLTPAPDKEPLQAWDAPVDAQSANSPTATLCRTLAETLAGWFARGDRLESAGRALRPDDVLILVQSRGTLFRECLSALSRAGVPTAGADRLQLLDDAAVLDLLSYARAVLSPTDDLALAETLKSPFFGFDDDALFAVAYDRPGSLEAALAASAPQTPARRAYEALIEARRIGLRQGAFAFFSHLLESGDPPGRRRLYARLGARAGEPIDELLRQALDYENARPRSLQGFVTTFSARGDEIKRETEQNAPAVRVMTVHGSKGLEANVVILLDAHRPPRPDVGPAIDAPGPIPAPIFVAGKDAHPDAMLTARERALALKYEEYRRLFYVAATRARDRLVICGLESGRNKDPRGKATDRKTWHALAEDAFDRLEGDPQLHVSSAPFEAWPGAVRRCALRGAASVAADAAVATAPKTTGPAQPTMPDWLFRPAPPEAPARRAAPSRLADAYEANDGAPFDARPEPSA